MNIKCFFGLHVGKVVQKQVIIRDTSIMGLHLEDQRITIKIYECNVCKKEFGIIYDEIGRNSSLNQKQINLSRANGVLDNRVIS